MTSVSRSISPVAIQRKALAEFAGVIGESKTEQLTKAAEETRGRLNGRRWWHVNSTATGGGVAELLLPLLGYANGLGFYWFSPTSATSGGVCLRYLAVSVDFGLGQPGGG